MLVRWINLFLLALASIAPIHPAEHAKKSLPGVIPLNDPPGIHNLYALGTNLFSGSSPDTEQAFAALAKLGVKTLISVDGSKPNVALAKKYRMTYAHLPHGYDGISTNLQLQLVKAAETLTGPIYVHCHHGKHRGPAAAAVICMATQSWSSRKAEDWLTAAGTATNYAGLYQTVREFRPPTTDDLKRASTKFPETAQVSGLVDLMVGIDQRWEHLKSVRAAGYKAPPDHPDLNPANESVILWEAYREAQRLPEAKHLGHDFLARLESAEKEVRSAETLLRSYTVKPDADLRAKLDAAFSNIGNACSTCHRHYRDKAIP